MKTLLLCFMTSMLAGGWFDETPQLSNIPSEFIADEPSAVHPPDKPAISYEECEQIKDEDVRLDCKLDAIERNRQENIQLAKALSLQTDRISKKVEGLIER